jgi:hypothetical protein
MGRGLGSGLLMTNSFIAYSIYTRVDYGCND